MKAGHWAGNCRHDHETAPPGSSPIVIRRFFFLFSDARTLPFISSSAIKNKMKWISFLPLFCAMKKKTKDALDGNHYRLVLYFFFPVVTRTRVATYFDPLISSCRPQPKQKGWVYLFSMSFRTFPFAQRFICAGPSRGDCHYISVSSRPGHWALIWVRPWQNQKCGEANALASLMRDRMGLFSRKRETSGQHIELWRWFSPAPSLSFA